MVIDIMLGILFVLFSFAAVYFHFSHSRHLRIHICCVCVFDVTMTEATDEDRIERSVDGVAQAPLFHKLWGFVCWLWGVTGKRIGMNLSIRGI